MVKDSITLQTLIAPIVAALGYEFVGCFFTKQGRDGLLRIYIDSEKGITVDDCQRVSRQVSALLDVEDPIPGHYTLEVSSPGLDRPLFTREQYQRFIGQKVQIHLRLPQNGRRNFKGLLKAVVDEGVIVVIDNEEFLLSLADIERANLDPQF